MDMMLVSSTEDIDVNQIYFERKQYMSEEKDLKRLNHEREIDYWDAYMLGEKRNEENKISNRQRAIERVSRILETLS